ncbi:MAG: DUF262 domain-containing HNH endonuclease family protein [Treponema sp.]
MQTETHSINDVLVKNATSFFIPPFQRAYAWGKPEIDRYFHDITRIIHSEHDAAQTDKLEHFFGTLVIKEEKAGFVNKSIIVDGQQRLTTTLLFLIALRDNEHDQEKKNFITHNYLTNSSSTFQDKIKLKQVTKDWEAYRALVNGQQVPTGIIKNGYDRFSYLISQLKKTKPEITLEDYILAIQRINVAVIFLDERPFKGEDPQIIFETLNSLGKPLTLSDLIRNYILLNMDSKNQSTIYEQIWYPRIELQLKENTSDFFRDFLQYKTATSIKAISDNNTKELYAEFKKFVEITYANHKLFIDDIVQYVTLYKSIIYENIREVLSSDRTKDREIKELLRNIFHDIKTEAFKPFVIGLLYHHQNQSSAIPFTDDALIAVLKIIRTYLIRRRIVKLTQGENKSIVLLCNRIPDVVQAKIEMIYLLSNMFYKMRLPNDDEMRQTFTVANFYEDFKNYRKFILGKIEEHNAKVSVDFRDQKITIEHIMPQTLNAGWKSALGDNYAELHKKYIHNIGNLILTEFNGEMGNDSLTQKKKLLNTSSLYYRLEILSADRWDEEAIKKHQANMINWFLETFPLPEQYQHTNNWNSQERDITDFSPLDTEAGDIAEGNKPLHITIEEQLFQVSTWQEVFLTFIDFIKTNENYDFQCILDNQTELFNNENILITWPVFEKLLNKNGDLINRYKTLEGLTFDKLETVNEDMQFVHINISASTCMTRIANIMNKLNLPNEFVNIRLK